MKLSERLEAEIGYWPRTSTLNAVLREAAELARRVEEATAGRRYARAKDDWIVTPDEDGGVDFPYQRVRIVAEE